MITAEQLEMQKAMIELYKIKIELYKSNTDDWIRQGIAIAEAYKAIFNLYKDMCKVGNDIDIPEPPVLPQIPLPAFPKIKHLF